MHDRKIPKNIKINEKRKNDTKPRIASLRAKDGLIAPVDVWFVSGKPALAIVEDGVMAYGKYHLAMPLDVVSLVSG